VVEPGVFSLAAVLRLHSASVYALAYGPPPPPPPPRPPLPPLPVPYSSSMQQQRQQQQQQPQQQQLSRFFPLLLHPLQQHHHHHHQQQQQQQPLQPQDNHEQHRSDWAFAALERDSARVLATGSKDGAVALWNLLL
jgi:hypothetical protein